MWRQNVQSVSPHFYVLEALYHCKVFQTFSFFLEYRNTESEELALHSSLYICVDCHDFIAKYSTYVESRHIKKTSEYSDFSIQKLFYALAVHIPISGWSPCIYNCMIDPQCSDLVNSKLHEHISRFSCNLLFLDILWYIPNV